MEHIFWAPTPCFDLYQKYGDVVVFYTTYKVNAYDMPFGICVGINNHGTLLLNLVVDFQQLFVVNRYGIEPNILFEMLGLLLKKSPI